MKPLEKESYAIILEKAWATIYGGYEYNVLNKILGTSCRLIYNKNMKILT